jgi:putative hydrolase of the HAD superfamily
LALIAAVIFDLGDTLVKTPWGVKLLEKGSSNEIAKFESTVKATFDSLVKSGIETEWHSFYDRYMSVRAKQLELQKADLKEYDMCERVAMTLEALGVNIPSGSKVIKKAIEDNYDSYESYIEIEEDVPRVLKDLKRRYRLGLITNFAYPPTIHKLLSDFHLKHFFDVVVISGEVGWVKPSPRIFESALSRLKLEAEQCIFVGDDTEADIKGASGIGMKTIFISKAGTRCEDADANIKQISEAPLAIEELARRETELASNS